MKSHYVIACVHSNALKCAPQGPEDAVFVKSIPVRKKLSQFEKAYTDKLETDWRHFKAIDWLMLQLNFLHPFVNSNLRFGRWIRR